MGEVYKAFDPSLDRIVALKTIRADADNPSFLDRLYREAKACGRLRHPRIVTVYDLGEVEGVVFIAMEYLEGDNLAVAMQKGVLNFEAKIRVLMQILEGLQYAHGEGVVHRDIKPGNVHMMLDGSAKLLDFGLARVARAESLTMTGAVMGTPYYMSPEQLKGQKVDGRSDVFSTGVVAYELFTNRRAFDGENITTVMLKVLSDPPPPMETSWSAAFPEIERIVTRAMAKSADDRYATAEDMKNALAAFLASSQTAIAKTQADVTIQSNRAIHEAKTLIQKDGWESESLQALLAETIRMNPDAAEARTLLNQARYPRDASQVTVVAPRQESRPEPVTVPAPRAAAPPPPPPPPPGPVRMVERGAQPMGPQEARTAVPPPQSSQPSGRSRGAMWIGLAAAVVVAFGVVTLVTGQRAAAPANEGAGVPGAAVPGAVPGAEVQGASAQVPPPAAVPPQTAQAAPSTPAAPATQSPAPVRPAPNAPARAAANSRAVQIEASADAALNSALTQALSARGVAVQTGAAGARLAVRATSQVTVRPSPFQGNSALTADYVGTLQIRNAVSGARQTLSFDGHALDFGDAVVKATATRALADQMAEAIEQAVRE